MGHKPKKHPVRKRYWGMVKLRKGQKTAWLSQENRNGWSLGLAMESHTVWLRNVRFASKADLLKAMHGEKVVFTALKYPIKK